MQPTVRVDTADSVLIVSAYGWAFTDPERQRVDHVTVTVLSILVALGIGGIEAGGLLADRLGLGGTGWDVVRQLALLLGVMGYGIIAVSGVVWLAFAFLYRRRPPGAYDPVTAESLRPKA